MKMLIEELMKQVRDAIKQPREEIVLNFAVHSEAIHKRVSELEATNQIRYERVTGLESAAAVFHKSFKGWKPQVDESLASVKFNSFDRDAKQSVTSKLGVQ
jgi:hypothetical protein